MFAGAEEAEVAFFGAAPDALKRPPRSLRLAFDRGKRPREPSLHAAFGVREGLAVGRQGFCRVAFSCGHKVRRRSGGDHRAALVPAFGPQVDHPVACSDDVEIVLHDEHGVAVGDEAPQARNKFGDVRKVQASGGFVKDKKGGLRASSAGTQDAGELQALRFAARQGGDALAQRQVPESHVCQGLQFLGDGLCLVVRSEPRDGVVHGHRKNVRNASAFPCVARKPELYFQRLRPESRAAAFRAFDHDVAQELHFDALDACAVAHGAAARSVVEAEPRAVVAAVHSGGRACKELADVFKGADVEGGGGA